MVEQPNQIDCMKGVSIEYNQWRRMLCLSNNGKFDHPGNNNGDMCTMNG